MTSDLLLINTYVPTHFPLTNVYAHFFHPLFALFSYRHIELVVYILYMNIVCIQYFSERVATYYKNRKCFPIYDTMNWTMC